MAKKPPIVIYSGMKDVGKTTYLNPILQELGYEVVSTSVALHTFTAELFKILFNIEAKDFDTRAKGIQHMIFCAQLNTGSYSRTYTQTRPLLINIAEDALVRVFGRGIFAYYASRIIKTHFRNNKPVALESVGGEELDLVLSSLTQEELKNCFKFNLRRTGEIVGEDLRKFIPGVPDIWNDSTREDLKMEVESQLNNW